MFYCKQQIPNLTHLNLTQPKLTYCLHRTPEDDKLEDRAATKVKGATIIYAFYVQATHIIVLCI